jgi:hypothetical protein
MIRRAVPIALLLVVAAILAVVGTAVLLAGDWRDTSATVTARRDVTVTVSYTVAGTRQTGMPVDSDRSLPGPGGTGDPSPDPGDG